MLYIRDVVDDHEDIGGPDNPDKTTSAQRYPLPDGRSLFMIGKISVVIKGSLHQGDLCI